MGEALAWLGQIADWIGRFIPRWLIVDVTQGGVKYVRGYKISVLTPGIHWWWPATTRLDIYPVAFQTDNLPSQTMETKDGVSITVGGLITYTVDDIQKLLTTTHSAIKMIQVLTLAAIHETCCRMDWEELKEHQRKGTLDTKLRKAAQSQLTDFGVKVHMCQLTDLVRSKAYRLIESSQKDEVEDGLTPIG